MSSTIISITAIVFTMHGLAYGSRESTWTRVATEYAEKSTGRGQAERPLTDFKSSPNGVRMSRQVESHAGEWKQLETGGTTIVQKNINSFAKKALNLPREVVPQVTTVLFLSDQ